MENTEDLSVEKKLDKLEISATIPVVKLLDEHLPLSLNPFYVKSSETNNGSIQILFGKGKESDISSKKCTCLRVRNVEKEDSGKSEFIPLIRGTQFKSKHKKKQTRNSFIKEPRLKDIGKCLHRCALALKTRSVTEKDSSNENDSETDLSIELKSHLSLGKELNEQTFGNNGAFSDFRSLIDQCANISLAGPETTSHDYTQKSFKTLRNSNRESINRPKLRPKTPPPLVATAGSSSSTSSSCSQQARMQCDVTINEIASYFELLYIPKKMSSMAESMYI